jgi:tetratricopeptide (TPR) repeat protein
VSRHRKTGSAEDRSEALAAIERALRECAPQSPDLAGFQFNLALVLELGGTAAESSAGARAAEAFRSAARNEVGPVRIRALAARGWADKAAENGEWEEALSAYAQAVSHAQAWAWHGAERDDTFAALEEIAGVANDAAAVAIRLGRLEQALGLLEQGHGVAYSRAVGLNADRVALRAARPDLAERVDRIRQSLDAPSDPERAVERTTIGLRLRQNLARDWDDVLAEVRREPEFADFLRPPRLGDVMDLAAEGPVVVVNISKHQCDALLITTAGISAISLPGVTAGAARRQASLLLTALNSRKLPSPFRDQAERTAHRVLSWIWDAIAEPVTSALGCTGAGRSPDDLPRIWWYPTGVARFLPLHAAGHHPNQPPAPGKWRSSAPTMLHRAKSSYVPTLSTLRRARARPAPDLAATALIVAVPDAPGLTLLDGVSSEVERIQPHFVKTKLLESRDATRAALLAHLPGTHILHFAGHGDQPPKRGAHGLLMTYDFRQTGPVSMADIARLDLPHADLAFLSACETARGDAALADESVHVAGALHMAGFTHTIGTRWVTGDYVSAEVSDHFYRYLREAQCRNRTVGHSDVAAALHAAMVRLYRECAHLPLAWAQYVHTGP